MKPYESWLIKAYHDLILAKKREAVISMKRVGNACLISVLFVMIGIHAAVAAPLKVEPEEALRQAFPQIKMDSFRPTDIKGLYEVTFGQRILYYFPGNDYLFVGEIYRKDGRNLTAERRGELTANLVKTLPLEKAVKVGDGKKVVIEISDPDCPFCRTASEYFSKRTDVTRYVFFAPLAHPAAINKIHYILEAGNKAAAYEEMMRGSEIPQSAPVISERVKALAQEHMDLARKIGVQGTPTFFIKGQMVVGADLEKMDNLLKE